MPEELRIELTELPIPRRKDWPERVDLPQTPTEEAAVQKYVKENPPFGDEQCLKKMKTQHDWREPLKHGRPRKANKK